MADSSINVTEGSGKRLQTYDHTVAAVLVQRQAVVLGEQALASYIVGQGTGGAAVSTATANSHLLQIMAGSSLNVRIRRIEMHQSAMATVAALGQVNLVRLTTAGTGGTSQTPNGLDPSDAAAGATAMTLPSSKGTEGAIILTAQPYFMQTGAVSAQLRQPMLVWDFDRPRSKALIIAAGTANGIAVKMVSATAGATVWVYAWFDETAW